MRKACFLGFICALFPRAGRAEVPAPIAAANSEVAASFDLRQLSYSEHNNGLVPGAPDTLDSESGFLPGLRVQASLQHDLEGLMGASTEYFAASLSVLRGTVAYDGAMERLSSDGRISLTPYTATSGATLFGATAAEGISFRLGDSAALTPLLHYGFREWWRKLGQGTAQQYQETYTHHELGVGALGQFAFGDRVVVDGELTVGAVVAASMEDDLAPSTSVETTLKAGPLVSGAIGIDFALSPEMHLLAAYRARFFTYGRSAPVSLPPPNQDLGVTEPDSSSFEQNVDVSFGWSFGSDDGP